MIWYCTGGIRCEKAAVLANQASGTEFYSIQGGVVKYVNQYNDGNWLGNLYTFDGRVSTEVGDAQTHTTIGECLYTGEATDNCENCRYSPCNARLIATEKAYRNHMGFCSQECYLKGREDGLIKTVPWDKLNYLELGRTWRADSEKKSEIFQLIQKNLDGKLAKVEWKHKTSQKEDMILEC